jgi:molybdopterin/thiamine biosynthesis adenylyltransferase
VTIRGAAIVGVGGLGAPAAAALAASGVSALTLIDDDLVEISNLPRQPLYDVDDVGTPKVEAAARRLRARRTDLRVESVRARVDAGNADALLAGHAVILDGTDGLPSKSMLNDAALALGIPLVHAGAVGLDGQLFTILPGRTACLRCLFPELPGEDDLPTCQQSGILGPVVGAVGLAAAGEARRILAGAAPELANRLAILDGARVRWRVVGLRPNPRCPACDAGRATT